MQQVDELKTVEGDGQISGGTAGSSKVSFSQDQQSRVQELIDEAYRKAYAKAHRTITATDEVENLRAEIDGLKEEKKKAALYRAISRYNVVDAEEVAKLIGETVRMDESGNMTVVNGTGSSVINTSGHPMGMDEHLAHWLSERPHHLRSSGASGAGSQGVRFSGDGSMRHNLTDPSVWHSIPREELDRLLREGVNVHGSAGQVYRFRDVKNPFLDARKRRFRKGTKTKVNAQ